MSGQWRVLAGSKLRQTWNHRLRFGRSGIWLILLELAGPAMLIWLNFALLKKILLSKRWTRITASADRAAQKSGKIRNKPPSNKA